MCESTWGELQVSACPLGACPIGACPIGACPIGSTFSVGPVGLLQKLLLLLRMISLRAQCSLWLKNMFARQTSAFRFSLSRPERLMTESENLTSKDSRLMLRISCRSSSALSL